MAENKTKECSQKDLNALIEGVKNRITKRGNLSHITIEEQHAIVDALASFDLGRHMLIEKELNGFWTHYIVTYPEMGKITGCNEKGLPLSDYEKLLLEKTPTCVATQERYHIFKMVLQSKLKENIKIASIACGLMGELIDLDYSGLKNFELVGVDIDDESIAHAKKFAEMKKIADKCSFYIHDAWQLPFNERFDLLSSNGLNMYVQEKKRVIALYRKFYEALKKGGVLVTSFLSPPPGSHSPTEWKLDHIVSEDMHLQKVLVDILEPKFQNYFSQKEIESDLKEVGFQKIDVHYDRGHIFPTVVAYK